MRVIRGWVRQGTSGKCACFSPYLHSSVETFMIHVLSGGNCKIDFQRDKEMILDSKYSDIFWVSKL